MLYWISSRVVTTVYIRDFVVPSCLRHVISHAIVIIVCIYSHTLSLTLELESAKEQSGIFRKLEWLSGVVVTSGNFPRSISKGVHLFSSPPIY